METQASDLLSQYIQFDTTNPPGNEADAIEFLADVLRRHGFEPRIIESAPKRANLIVRLPAAVEPAQPPCLLYAHADVVPADGTGWSVPPFAGQVKDGYVWGRGALDDKGLGIIFLQAIILLKQFQIPLQRDIILLIAADEEVHGQYGVAWLLEYHPELIEADYVWDEGGMGLRHSPNPLRYLYNIAVAEKKALTVRLVAQGAPGHAALPQRNNPQDRLVAALSRIKRWKRPCRLTQPVIEMLHTLAPIQSFPRSYLFAWAGKPIVWPFLRPLLENDPLFAALVRDTVNLTMLRGGQASNVVSAQAEAKLDMRLLPGEDPSIIVADLRSVISDAKVSIELESIPPVYEPSTIDTDFYRALVDTLQRVGPAGLATPYLTPGATDSRFFRRAGMKAYGFMPMLLDSHELGRIHGVDERVSTANLRWGARLVLKL